MRPSQLLNIDDEILAISIDYHTARIAAEQEAIDIAMIEARRQQ